MIGLLLLAATVGTTGIVAVPGGRWQALPISIPVGGRLLDVDFQVTDGRPVQVFIISRADRQRFRRGLKIEPIVATQQLVESGNLRQSMPVSGGEYLLIIDNRSNRRQPATVEISIELRDNALRLARELSPARRRAVVAISLGFFGATVASAAWLMLRRL